MSDFFHGWRRKAGCVLLALEAVLTLAWGRSFVACDILGFRQQQGTEGGPNTIFLSTHGYFGYASLSHKHQTDSWALGWLSCPPDQIDHLWSNCEVVNLFGFARGSVPKTLYCFFIWDGWIVLSLALLSAYLILWPGKRPAKLATQ